jgi:transcriptional regulator with XRE-family HTH domain
VQRQPETPGHGELFLAKFIGTAIRDGRRRLGLSQRDLSTVAGVPQSTISRLESGLPTAIPLAKVGRLLDRLECRIDASIRPPLVMGRPSERDAVHARILRYVERWLRRLGFETAREVPIGGDRVRGWLDLLAWRERDRVAVLGEVKGDIDDVGAFERQIAWYERDVWAAARELGWRPARVVVLGSALASRRNAEVVRAHSDALRRRFPTSPAELLAVLDGQTPAQRTAVLTFVDPLRRRGSWVLPTPLFGGHPVLPYGDARDLRSRLTGVRWDAK